MACFTTYLRPWTHFPTARNFADCDGGSQGSLCYREYSYQCYHKQYTKIKTFSQKCVKKKKKIQEFKNPYQLNQWKTKSQNACE